MAYRDDPRQQSRPCAWSPCGKIFQPKYKAAGRPPQEHCSKPCATSARNAARYPDGRDLERQRTRDLAKARKRRTRQRVQGWDGISDDWILRRDNWTCQLCGQPIDQALKHPAPGSRSVDHIIPLAQGGSDLAANKQAAHLGCNKAKGNRLSHVA